MANDKNKQETLSKKDKVQTVTMGCRLNIYESQVMKDHAQSQNMEDVVIVNTCAVTNEAERQSRQAVRKINRDNPGKKIIVTGCSAQLNPKAYSKIEGVVRILGNKEKMLRDNFEPIKSEKQIVKINETAEPTLENPINFINADTVVPDIRVSDIMRVKENAVHLISGFSSKHRAFIEIQNGCNHHCTFCSIPLARGRNRSIPIAQITSQIESLIDNNCQEVVFTGVDITDYGQDLPGKPTLTNLIKRTLGAVPKLKRLRLSSLDPSELNDDFFELFAKEKRIMPHLHISLQHGDDEVLQAMKRRHSRQGLIDFCKKARIARPEVLFGCDIIAGFPTETDEHFENAIALIKICNITYLHVFPYSARKGTPAARMAQLPKEVIKKRAKVLREIGAVIKKKNHIKQIGSYDNILVESDNKGYGERYSKVKVLTNNNEALHGVIKVKIIEYSQDDDLLVGKQFT